MHITRIAPSPTGMFHIGSARTALFNYLAAKSSNGVFILRIDNTDLERSKDEYMDVIYDSIHWLELRQDMNFEQSRRIKTYQQIAFDLVKASLAKELDNGAIALNTADISLPESFTDTLGGIIPITETNKKQIEQVILLRGLKGDPKLLTTLANEIETFRMPTYQFTSVVDDYLMGVNWIIRGTDHISNTPKQIAIWEAINKLVIPSHTDRHSVPSRELPKFTHIGLIHKDKKKLSKRDNAASLLWYKENGYSALAILNFLLRMGWGSRNDKNQLYTLEEMVKIFPEGNMRSAPSNFDQAKLDYYNKLSKTSVKITKDIIESDDVYYPYGKL